MPSNVVRPEDSDYLVLFNLDQPFESYCIAQSCVEKRVPFAIYTLHHKREWTEKFLNRGTSGAQKWVARALGGNALRYESVASFLRNLKHPSVGQILRTRTANHMQRYLVSKADTVVTSCSAEARCIEDDTSVSLGRIAVIPHFWNATEGPVGYSGSAAYATDLLCAGRIEPRKNQLALARFVQSSTDRSLLFIGKKNASHPAYIAELERTIASCPRISWLDHVSKEALYGYLASCGTYINVSWFEVFSLVDLIALKSGARCIFSKGSYLFDELGPSAASGLSFVDPSDLSGLLALLDTAAERSLSPIALPASVSPDPQLLIREWSRVLGASA